MYFLESHFFATFIPPSPPFLAMLCAYVDVAPNGSSSFSSSPPNPHFLAPRSEGGGGGTAIKQGGERKKAADAPPFFLRWGKRRRSRREQHRKIIFPLSLLGCCWRVQAEEEEEVFLSGVRFRRSKGGRKDKGGTDPHTTLSCCTLCFQDMFQGEGCGGGTEVTSAASFFGGGRG